jgi:hypothetical protein
MNNLWDIFGTISYQTDYFRTQNVAIEMLGFVAGLHKVIHMSKLASRVVIQQY